MPSFSLQFPIIFILVPIILIIWYIFFREKNGITPPNPLLKKYLKTPKSISLLWLCRALSIFLLLAIGAGFSVQMTRFSPQDPDSEALIVLDISRSMLAEESGKSRIEEAKKVISDFVASEKKSTFGLVIFAGKPFLVITKSSDTASMQRYISQISVESIRQNLPGLSGTNISDALLLAGESFSGEARNKKIILITDGDANLGGDPSEIASQVFKKNIKVFTIALMSENPEDPLSYTDNDGILHYLQDENGEKVYGIQNPQLLQNIATNGGGRFFESKSLSDLGKIFEDIGNTENSQKIIKKEVVSFSLSPLFLLLFLVFFGIERGYTRYIFRSVYRR